MRAAFRNQQLPVFVRMLDKDSAWGQSNGLRSLIPTALAYSIAGYPFVLPDMIGGNGVPGKPGAVPPDRELFVRWAELTAFMPAMQFSFAPWQYDDETVAIVRKFVHLHETAVGDELERAAKDAVLHGTWRTFSKYYHYYCRLLLRSTCTMSIFIFIYSVFAHKIRPPSRSSPILPDGK